MRHLNRLSLVLLVLVLIYWLIARLSVSDFRNISGDKVKFPTASCVIGSFELAWIMDQGHVMIGMTHNPGGEAFPLLGRLPVLTVLLGSPPGLTWTSGIESTRFFGGGSITVRGQTASGRAVVLRLFYLRLLFLAAVLSVLPGVAGIRTSLRRTKRLIRTRRVWRTRKIRNRLGQCACGYDLRSTRHRCPECGRPVRWLPVSMPMLKPTGSQASGRKHRS